MRSISFAILTLGAFVALGISYAHPKAVRPGPRTMEEVVAAAEKNGFVCRTEMSGDYGRGRVVISTKPLDDDEAAEVGIAIPRTGTATCCVAWECSHVHHDSVNSAFWGEMFVFGDPEIVAAIVATGASAH